MKGNGIREVGGLADKTTYIVRELTIDIISQQMYFVARCLISCVDIVFGLHSVCPQASDVGKAYGFVPGALDVWYSSVGVVTNNIRCCQYLYFPS
jgi:hypothetical protein